MSFHETYREEVLQTRRIRASRARFWGRILSLVLGVTMATILLTEPRLRLALLDSAMTGVAQIAGLDRSPAETAQAEAALPKTSRLPTGAAGTTVKINRPAGTGTTLEDRLTDALRGAADPNVPLDPAALADVARQLSQSGF